MGIVSPYGVGTELFASGIQEGRSGVKRIESFDPTEFRCQIAAEVSKTDENRLLTPSEERKVSRSVLLGMTAASESLSSAGLDPNALTKEERERFGVVIGSAGGGVDFAEKQYEIFFSKNGKRISPFSMTGSLIGMVSSEISIFFGFRGLSHVITTGCTSSTDAVGNAMLHLQSGRLDYVLTGGVEACVTPGVMTSLEQMRVLTTSFNHDPAKGSRPFNRDRNGFVLGEGAYLFLLESENSVRKRGSTVFAELIGYGSTCEAYHRVRMRDDGSEPARAMRMALQESGYQPEEVSYINLHGTSTTINDAVETRAVKLLLGKRAYDVPCSSTKSMLGHPQGASGAMGLAATVIGLNRGFLPPTINLENPDPECDLFYVPNRSLDRPMDLALCNCVAFGARNSAVAIRKFNGSLFLSPTISNEL